MYINIAESTEFLIPAPSLTICNLKKSLSLARSSPKHVKDNTLKKSIGVLRKRGKETLKLA